MIETKSLIARSDDGQDNPHKTESLDYLHQMGKNKLWYKFRDSPEIDFYHCMTIIKLSFFCYGRGGLLYLDLAKGTLFRTLLGTFSEGVFAVHSEFSAVSNYFL